MKKLILLALVALVAGAAFAMTDPAFSGNFEFRSQYNFVDKDAASDDAEGEAVINLNGVVDEWSTVNAEITGGGDGGPLSLNEFTLTTDVTGAFGIDSAVEFTFTWGAITHQAAKYYDKAGYGDGTVALETSSALGLVTTFTVNENVNFIAMATPMTYFSSDWTGNPSDWDAPVMGFEVQFLQVVEGLDANVWFTQDKNSLATNGGNDAVDFGDFSQVGVGAGYGSDMFDAGFVFVGEFVNDLYGFGVTSKLKMDIFDFGLAFFATDVSNDFGGTSSIGVNLTWKAIPDALDLFAAVNLPFTSFGDRFGVDAGFKFYIGAVTYVLGYDYQNAGFEGPEITTGTAGGAYLKVKADF